mmetsp:Transcript_39140/g.75941  ORF Transcript_39140/g.75941 Transcript_39140/m.75941 type:complete len:282 (-) Transcript_39140:166-1011(-)
MSKPFNCPVEWCKKAFTTQIGVFDHQRYVHPDTVTDKDREAFRKLNSERREAILNAKLLAKPKQKPLPPIEPIDFYRWARGTPMKHNRWLLVNLKEKKLNPNLELMTGERALHVAAQARNLDAVKLLLDLGAEVNARDSKGKTALMLAAFTREGRDIIECLLEKKAEVDFQDSEGGTALMRAARYGNKAVMQYLLDHGNANPLLRNRKGKTAEDLGLYQHTRDILRKYVAKKVERGPGDKRELAAAKRGFIRKSMATKIEHGQEDEKDPAVKRLKALASDH